MWPENASVWFVAAIVVCAAAAFLFLYIRYKRDCERQDDKWTDALVGDSSSHLKTYYDANGNLRKPYFDPEVVVDPTIKNDSEEKKKKKGVFAQVAKAITSGKLVHMINNFQMKTKSMGKKFERPKDETEQLFEAREAQLRDESVNPLYDIRLRQAELDSDSDSTCDEANRQVQQLSENKLSGAALDILANGLEE